MDYSVPCIYGRIKNKKAVVKVPGSKSITARALLAAALAEGTSVLYGAGLSDDCRTFIGCIESLGIKTEVSGDTVTVHGCGGKLPVSRGEVYVGSAGTAARFITALLAFCEGEFVVRSSEQMKARPVAPLISALEGAGASFEFIEKPYCFPFIIRGTCSPAKSITVDIDKSSQFLSAAMMVAVCAKDGLEIRVQGSHGMKYVDMTADIMWSFGVEVGRDGDRYIVPAGEKYVARRYDTEPDISAACYFYAMNRILGTDISVKGVMPHSMQGDVEFIKLMRGGFDGGSVDMSAFSDQALTMAAVAPYFSRPTEIHGISHIRGQECDRINAIMSAMQAMNVRCKLLSDGVKIYPSVPCAAQIETFGDHRVAMSFAVTGLRAEGVVIKNAEVCSKTFGDYFSVLDGLIKNLTL